MIQDETKKILRENEQLEKILFKNRTVGHILAKERHSANQENHLYEEVEGKIEEERPDDFLMTNQMELGNTNEAILGESVEKAPATNFIQGVDSFGTHDSRSFKKKINSNEEGLKNRNLRNLENDAITTFQDKDKTTFVEFDDDKIDEIMNFESESLSSEDEYKIRDQISDFPHNPNAQEENKLYNRGHYIRLETTKIFSKKSNKKKPYSHSLIVRRRRPCFLEIFREWHHKTVEHKDLANLHMTFEERFFSSKSLRLRSTSVINVLVFCFPKILSRVALGGDWGLFEDADYLKITDKYDDEFFARKFVNFKVSKFFESGND